MKAKHLFLAIAALLAAGGLWLARSTWRSDHSALPKSSTDAAFKRPSDGPKAGQMLQPPKPGQMLRPPDPSRRFTDFTPEQRVEFARKGHGPGG
jgi:hypothetical protein